MDHHVDTSYVIQQGTVKLEQQAAHLPNNSFTGMFARLHIIKHIINRAVRKSR